jgi:hypothetical protein
MGKKELDWIENVLGVPYDMEDIILNEESRYFLNGVFKK